MKVHSILISICLAALLSFLTGCDENGGTNAINAPGDPDISIDPGTGFYPNNPPHESTPFEDLVGDDGDDGGDDPGDPNGGTGSDDNNQQPVPEPSTLVLVGSGLAVISLCRRKRKNAQKNEN